MLMWAPPPRSNVSSTHSKKVELQNLQKEAKQHLRKWNQLYLEYADWHRHQCESFVGAVKTLQVVAHGVVPRDVTCISDLKKMAEIAEIMKGNGRNFHNFHKLLAYLDFWERFCHLKDDLEHCVLLRLENALQSTVTLRKEDVRTEILAVKSKLIHQSKESFKCSSVELEKENLYTYNVTSCDSRYEGLVRYLPILFGYAARLCYLVGHLKVEEA